MFVKIWQDQSASFEEMEGRGRSYSISGCRKLNCFFFDPTHCVIQPSDPPLEMLYYRSHVTVRWCLTWETHVNPFVSNAGLLIGRLLEAVLLLNNSMRAIKSHLLTIGNINHVCTLVIIYSTLLMDQCWTIHGLTLCLHYEPFNINLMIHVYAL